MVAARLGSGPLIIVGGRGRWIGGAVVGGGVGRGSV